MKTLNLTDISVSVEDTNVVSDVSLQVNPGEMHWMMGPNGSGKSTLANALMGHPKYQVTRGTIYLGGADVTQEPPHKRAGEGMFFSMQHPPALEGVTVTNLLKNAYNARFNTEVSVLQFRKLLNAELEKLQLSSDFASRYVHAGFSGGEKKRLELLQLSMLAPDMAILDEPDSGLDVDGLKMLSHHLNRIQERTGMGILVITHYTQMLPHLTPNAVHVLKNGRLVQTGDQSLAEYIQEYGYESLPTQ